MRKKNRTLLLLLLLIGMLPAGAQYRNPIINADVPDVSLVSHDGYYYMISTTMHLMPGAPIMRSKDLQHWQTVSYVFDSLEKEQDRYNLLNGENVYGRGQWASSLRYHNGKFWVWFTANGHPGRGFVFSADKAEGPWHLVARPPHFHDGSLLFDDDGKVYMFYGTGDLIELDPVTFQIKEGGLRQKTFERDDDEKALLEGSSVVKRNGMYYLCMISMDWSIPGRLRREVCYRAEKIEGPYTKRVILETPFERFGGVGQGCLVANEDSTQWHAVVFQDRGGIGRTPCLMPVHWISDDGVEVQGKDCRYAWPMLGQTIDGATDLLSPKSYRIPNDTTISHIRQTGVQGSDDFSGDKLSLLWQFNHNTIDEGISLGNGRLRLTTQRLAPNIFLAPNTITQRMPGPKCQGTVKIDVAGMKDGDVAGLAAFNGNSGVMSIRRNGKRYTLTMSDEVSVFDEATHRIVRDDVTEHETVTLKRPKGKEFTLYLRINGDFTDGRDIATFSYSLDGVSFTRIGTEHKMQFDYRRMFMGSKFAIFNYATKSTGGHIDIDEFVME